jgi:uncharacterized SAM-binding protein YcdF (DUF218 family)
MELSPFLYGLYKVAKYAVYPYTWLIVLIGLILLFTWLPASPRVTRWLRRLTLITLLLALFLGTPLVAYNTVGILEAWHPPRDPISLPKSDAIVVLGGGVAPQGKLRPATEPSQVTKERVLCGVDLFAHGLAPTLIMSGGDATAIGSGPHEAEAMKHFAVRLGVPDQAIMTETHSRTTYENAVEVHRLIQPSASVLLVTSAYHMPRAQYLFAQQKIHSTPYPCGYLSRNGPGVEWTWNPFSLIPTAGAFWQNSLAVSELIGLLVYSLGGRG